MGGSQSQDAPPAQTGGYAAASRSTAPSGTIVKLNVYSPSGGQHVAYHSGVEMFGAEYVFGGGDTSFSGVTAQRPRVPPPGSGWVFYQTVDIAPCRMSKEEALRTIQELRSEYPASSYDLVSRNCNHFSDALCRRLCNQGIPGWVNRLAGIGSAVPGIGSAVRSAVGGQAGSGRTVAEGAGGPAAAGLVARATPVDGDLASEVDWAGVGVLNAAEADAAEALRSHSAVSSEAGGSPELLMLLPFVSPVKLQKLVLEAPAAGSAPQRLRLFANTPDLDMDDAAGGAPATQEFQDVVWNAKSDGPVVTTTIEVNFLKFQKLGFLGIYAGMSDDDSSNSIAIIRLSLAGRT